MKKGMELLGADFVLDEFHLKKYVKRMVRSTGEQEREAEVNEWIKEGKKKELEEWEKEKACEPCDISEDEFPPDGLE